MEQHQQRAGLATQDNFKILFDDEDPDCYYRVLYYDDRQPVL
jgi:hypothetical protein